MISDLFHMYQKEIEDNLSLVKSQKIPAGDWKAAEEALKSCQHTLVLMENEARAGRDTTRKDTALVTVRSMRKEIETLLDTVKKNSLLNRSRFGSDDEEEERGGLLGGDNDDQQILKRSGQALHESRRVIGEIKQTAANIQIDLEAQSQTMHSISGKVEHTNRISTVARNLLRTIEKNETRNKLFAYGAVVAVFIGIVVAIYWVLFRT
jgi:hypothetical protein